VISSIYVHIGCPIDLCLYLKSFFNTGKDRHERSTKHPLYKKLLEAVSYFSCFRKTLILFCLVSAAKRQTPIREPRGPTPGLRWDRHPLTLSLFLLILSVLLNLLPLPVVLQVRHIKALYRHTLASCFFSIRAPLIFSTFSRRRRSCLCTSCYIDYTLYSLRVPR
jgi:hypothetical protein